MLISQRGLTSILIYIHINQEIIGVWGWSKAEVILGEDGLKPAGKMLRRVEAGKLIFRGMEDRVDSFTIGLPLHKLNGQVKIKMLRLKVAQLMLQGLVLLFGREGGVDVNVKAAVIIGQGDTLHRPGQGDLTDKIINHKNRGGNRSSVLTAESFDYFYGLTDILGACVFGKLKEHAHILTLPEGGKKLGQLILGGGAVRDILTAKIRDTGAKNPGDGGKLGLTGLGLLLLPVLTDGGAAAQRLGDEFFGYAFGGTKLVKPIIIEQKDHPKYVQDNESEKRGS